MNEFDRQRLDAIAAGQRPPKTPAEERVREQEEAGAILRRCMNNAKEEAISLRKQLDAAQAEIERLKADLDDLQEKYAQSESDRLDALAKIERLHTQLEKR